VSEIELNLKVNGEEKCWSILPGDRLSQVLRREGYLSVKVGCSTGDCGTCTVLLDGKPVLSCLMLAAQAEGCEVTTVEALSDSKALHPLQEAFLDEGAVQCGFCIPGMVLTAKALIEENPSPSEDEIRHAISGNLCRCTGYENPVRAIQRVVKEGKGGSR